MVRDQHQMIHPLGLGGVTAIPIAATELFELVVQISHGVISNGSVLMVTWQQKLPRPACAVRPWDTTPIRPEYAWSQATLFFPFG